MGFGVWSLEFGIWNLELGIWNFGIWNLEFWILDLGLWNLELWNLELGIWNLEFGTWNFGTLWAWSRCGPQRRRLPPGLGTHHIAFFALVMAMAHGLVLVNRPLRPRFCSPPVLRNVIVLPPVLPIPYTPCPPHSAFFS